MVTGLGVGGNVEQALQGVGVPAYVVDTTGIVRWINPAASATFAAASSPPS